MYGSAGTGVGSRIRGTARRGGIKIRKQHMRYGVVALTNEYRTSQTCASCFQQLRPAKARRQVNGESKVVRLHGSMECTNSRCESWRAGHTIMSRDKNAALCMAIAGGSTVLLNTTLKPFARSFRPPINTSQQTLETLTSHMPHSSVTLDAVKAPAGTAGKNF
ncbi:hypothetical protein B0O80DRAFT_393124 [Mortierella sp. GBAus27b]|nr:hypothetical protein B0O80DRAFT_393124 [Mortierella sp. GBAus27b]